MVDVVNNGLIAQLPDDCVIETNCVIGRNGAQPLCGADVPLSVIGLICQVKAYEILTIEAAVSGNRNTALQAFLNHPLVRDVRDARAALSEMLEANKEYLPRFLGKGRRNLKPCRKKDRWRMNRQEKGVSGCMYLA